MLLTTKKLPYLWFYNPTNDLVGYITLLTDAIRVHGTQLGKKFIDKGVKYKTIPSVKIGRMCVDKRYVNRGIGTHMVHFSMRILIDINEKTGCRFIVLDAKTETRTISFYKKLDFEILRQREKGTIPMFYDMIKLINYYKGQKKKLRTLNIKDETSR